MKKGIALIITVGFITILGAIIAYVFSFTQGVFNEALKADAKNQRTILHSDIKNMLDTYAKMVETNEDLTNFLLGIPPVYDEKSGLSLYVELEYLSNKININSLAVNENIVKFLKNIAQSYNILDISFFIALLKDTIDEDDIEKEALSEISREDIRFSNSRIVNKRHFKKILEYYVDVTKDESVLKVPWERLIYFGKTQQTVVDCDRMGKELISVLGFDEESFSGCANLEDQQYQEIAEKYNLKSFSKQNELYLNVKIFYEIEDLKDEIDFVYKIVF